MKSINLILDVKTQRSTNITNCHTTKNLIVKSYIRQTVMLKSSITCMHYVTIYFSFCNSFTVFPLILDVPGVH